MRPDPLASALMKAHPDMYTPVSEPDPQPVLIRARAAERPTERPRDVLHIASPEPSKITMDRILKAAVKASAYSTRGVVTLHELRSPRRYKNLVHWRHIAFALARKHTELTFPQIGRMIGGRDHSTVMHGVSRVDNEPEKYAFDMKLAETWL